MRQRTLATAARTGLLKVYNEWDGVTADVEATASARRTEPA